MLQEMLPVIPTGTMARESELNTLMKPFIKAQLQA